MSEFYVVGASVEASEHAERLRLARFIEQQLGDPPVLTTVRVNGADYSVPAPVAQEIGLLRDELAQSLALNAELRSDSQLRTDTAEMMDFLDELHVGLDHNMYRATAPLMHAFPEISRREATLAVMEWMDRWNEMHGKEAR